jgi:SAM-dependent methyltransferase
VRLFRKSISPTFLKDISKVFSFRVHTYGGAPAGVLWKNSEGQQLRFEVLAGILDDLPPSTPVTINDFGCGYGAMYDFLHDLPSMAEMNYFGYDISEKMINTALQLNNDRRATFSEASKIDTPADFTFVSGTFNLKLDVDDGPWNTYVKSTLNQLWVMSDKGLAFNMLDKNHPDQKISLYYANAEEYIDFCKTLSPDVAFINNYQLDEWTIFMRR